MSEYIEILINYFRDIIYSEVMRLMKVDYKTTTTFNYDYESKTNAIIKTEKEVQENLLKSIEKITENCIEKLKKFLENEKIDSPENYEKKRSKISDFLMKEISTMFQNSLNGV